MGGVETNTAPKSQMGQLWMWIHYNKFSLVKEIWFLLYIEVYVNMNEPKYKYKRSSGRKGLSPPVVKIPPHLSLSEFHSLEISYQENKNHRFTLYAVPSYFLLIQSSNESLRV